jgi:cellulose synthase/poly-beta-1,6-N-acetylglucosamine synthase-like glycosyltransferase
LDKKHTDTLASAPLVSILVAAKDEDSDRVISTLQGLINQTYSNIEILYLDNNSSTNTSFLEVQKHFSTSVSYVSGKLKLLRAKHVKGFKAGALNLLYTHVSKKSNYIATVDADYVTEREWIETALQYMNHDTSFVQFPQAYKKVATDNSIERGATLEQDYVFASIYPIRSIMGNIVQNGTMVLLNRRFLPKESPWPVHTVCEDALLGIQMSERGGVSTFVPKQMGYGVAPHNFLALRKQRFRWVFGAMQIIALLLKHPKKLTYKNHYIIFTDWVFWVIHILYPWLLLFSLISTLSVLTLYKYIQYTKELMLGFVFILTTITITVVFLWKKHPKDRVSIIDFLLIECALVNTIFSAVYRIFFTNAIQFFTTRKKYYISYSDIGALAINTVVVFFATYYIVLLILKPMPILGKSIAISQLFVLILPQWAYLYYRMTK